MMSKVMHGKCRYTIKKYTKVSLLQYVKAPRYVYNLWALMMSAGVIYLSQIWNWSISLTRSLDGVHHWPLPVINLSSNPSFHLDETGHWTRWNATDPPWWSWALTLGPSLMKFAHEPPLMTFDTGPSLMKLGPDPRRPLLNEVCPWTPFDDVCHWPPLDEVGPWPSAPQWSLPMNPLWWRLPLTPPWWSWSRTGSCAWKQPRIRRSRSAVCRGALTLAMGTGTEVRPWIPLPSRGRHECFGTGGSPYLRNGNLYYKKEPFLCAPTFQ